MGSEQIAHSVESTQAYAAEQAGLDNKIAEADGLDNKQTSPEPFDGVEVQIDPTAQKLFDELVAGKTDLLDKFSELNPDTVDLIEFQDFKYQVIAAFKHLGLDTRKHFTE